VMRLPRSVVRFLAVLGFHFRFRPVSLVHVSTPRCVGLKRDSLEQYSAHLGDVGVRLDGDLIRHADYPE